MRQFQQSLGRPEFSTLQSHRIHRPVPIVPPRISSRPLPVEPQQQFQVLSPTPVSSVGHDREQQNSSESSNELPIEYTRDKLLGAVEKVRSELPFRKQGLILFFN